MLLFCESNFGFALHQHFKFYRNKINIRKARNLNEINVSEPKWSASFRGEEILFTEMGVLDVA